MAPFQSAQRRALYQLNALGVPWTPETDMVAGLREKSCVATWIW